MKFPNEYLKMCYYLPEEFWVNKTFSNYAVYHGNNFEGMMNDTQYFIFNGEVLRTEVLKEKDYKAWYAIPSPNIEELFSILGDNVSETINLMYDFKVYKKNDLYPEWDSSNITFEIFALWIIMYYDFKMIWYKNKWVSIE